jgi:hypothetical protein
VSEYEKPTPAGASMNNMLATLCACGHDEDDQSDEKCDNTKKNEDEKNKLLLW